MKTKPIFKSWKEYDREIYMSEYVTINKEHYRRMRTCAVVSLGINLFIFLVWALT